MLEREFDLKTSPEVDRYYLHNELLEEKHVVTMEDVKEAFKDNQLELTRILNNKSSVWFLEKIY
ncbi:hypothetical protein AVU18_gp244 [Citrobacter phage IME-CF2]|jgi:hypothetical protein|uniref:Uncharacterized protein n=5 Tax=Pseudotevenvirus TaxID=2842979 RepID=A0A1B1IXY0_9CAUD|nr:hypothetical protein AVU18_gp244 [Citrobacter phage IME-CF2]YP_009285594.1 hypothetical protein BI032_gp056 [Citrobacter phage vB_CfrM_CfP1]YP_239032.1 gp45.2 conserved hypothetical protein [Escherichia phage RB43]QPX73081.1 hypothetical protein [Citrobacter phage vB_Cfr_Xman]CCK73905.1 protein of unknown function [Pseudotevenvirus RB43]AAX78578.1 gp45.2 conserved hypothetical protein [Escherichia phage RB43]AKR15986.1 hypothetical protein [Citrobacter phage IME-CF2]ANS06173.1 hypothetica